VSDNAMALKSELEIV